VKNEKQIRKTVTIAATLDHLHQLQLAYHHQHHPLIMQVQPFLCLRPQLLHQLPLQHHYHPPPHPHRCHPLILPLPCQHPLRLLHPRPLPYPRRLLLLSLLLLPIRIVVLNSLLVVTALLVLSRLPHLHLYSQWISHLPVLFHSHPPCQPLLIVKYPSVLID
jgi:hypothetical protein